MPKNGFYSIFNRIDKLSKHIRVRYWQYWRPGLYLAVDETIERFMGRALEIINIPSKPTLEGFKIWVLANKGYILN
jgi:Transposase IS4